MKAVGKYIVIKPQKDKTTTTKGGLILGEGNREDIRYKICLLYTSPSPRD